MATQLERRTDTRARLLAATVDCLVEHGYAGTTTQRVQDRAGLSRGALLHHFGTKESLLVAAVSHVADAQIGWLRTHGATARPTGIVALLHEAMSGPVFLAGLELWQAARTEPALRAALLPAERRVGAAVRALLTDLLPAAERADVEGLLALYRGLALASVLRADPELDRAVLQRWTERVLGLP